MHERDDVCNYFCVLDDTRACARSAVGFIYETHVKGRGTMREYEAIVNMIGSITCFALSLWFYLKCRKGK